MANTGFLSTSELDFVQLKNNLKTYLKNQDKFSDYDFEGSNINVLLDILAYNTYQNAFYLNMVGSEMFLDTAQLRESAVSHAKELNYLPRSRTSAVAYVDITIDTGNSTPSYVTIPKNYKFTTVVDSTTLNFIVPESIVVRPINGIYTASNTAIYEGSVVTEFFNITDEQQFLTLQSDNIDTTSIAVYVYESNTDVASYLYTVSDSLLNLTPTSNSFFIQGYLNSKYQIYFGNGVTGRQLSVGNLVKVEYRDTVGDLGNGAYLFSKTSPIDGYSDISITTNISASQGSERESTNSIKYNAPRHFAVQERAVTAEDFISLTKSRFPQLQSVNAYGGELLDPPQYGKVAITVKPFGSTGIISDSLKVNIVNFLKQKSLTTEPVIVDPEFFHVGVQSRVNFDSTKTSLSSNQIKTNAETAILNYAADNLVEFGDDVRYSKLVGLIDNVDPSVVSNETVLNIIRRWSPTPNVSSTLSFSFDNELYHEQTLYLLPDNHEHALYTSSFIYTHTDNMQYNAYIGDNGLGNLQLYTLQTVAGITTRKVLDSDAGNVNYYTGEVVIKGFVTSYIGSYISIYGVPYNKDISCIKNKFLLIEGSDINVTVSDVTR